MSNLGIAQSEITGAGGGGGGASLTFLGAWSNVVAYSTNNIVTRKGSVWIAAQGNTGVDPYTDNGTNWTLFAEGFNYAGTWLVGTAYNYFDVVTYNNSFYLSVVAGSQSNTGNNPQTDNGTHWALLDQGFNFRGAWSNLTTYQPYDVVTYLSSTYVGLTLNNLGNTPSTSTANWTLMAAAGQVAPRTTFTFNMPSASITSVSITSNVLTLTASNSFTTQGFGAGAGQLTTFYLTGLTTATFLNGQVITASSVTGTTVVANFTHGNYGPTADTGTVTMSIPNTGVYWTTIQLAPTFALNFVSCGQPNRIELYSSTTSRTNDASRPATVQPTQFTQHGVILDLNLDGVVASYTSWILSPLAYGANMSSPLGDGTSNIVAALTNISGGAPTTNGFSIIFQFTYEETGGVNTPNADEYVLGKTDTTNLPSAVANPTAYFGTDAQPATAGSLDDEFNGSSLNTATRWTWVNQGGATATVAKSTVDLHDPTSSAVDNFRVITQPIPTPPYQVTAKMVPSAGGVPANFNSAGGITVLDGTAPTNKLIYFGFNFNSGQNLVVNHYTNLTTFSATAATMAWVWQPGTWVYLRYNDDGTNVQYSWSTDGIVFHQLFQESRTAWLTPADVGLGLENVNSTIFCDLVCDWFRRTL